jgi:hypothetical protein
MSTHPERGTPVKASIACAGESIHPEEVCVSRCVTEDCNGIRDRLFPFGIHLKFSTWSHLRRLLKPCDLRHALI